jgi:selenocysteine lyase/cysteine desulfurase
MLDDASLRRDFPSLEGLAYLNTAAESVPPVAVHEAVEDYLRDKSLGMRGRDGHFGAVERCREVAARMVGMRRDEVSFCSCSSEAYNLLASAMEFGSRDEVVVSDLDFPAGTTPWQRMAVPPVLRVWRSAAGALRVTELEGLLGPSTRIVQVSLVSFYNGHRLDWADFIRTVRALAPQAVVAVDVTQALGRVGLDCSGADILISSTHKWTLGIHGGCVVGVPESGAERLTTRAGGWYHVTNAFDADRFERALTKRGAASFSVGMPNFVSLYALDAALRYVEGVGVSAIGGHADPLVARVDSELRALGLAPLCDWSEKNPSGIVAFRHGQSERMAAELREAGVEVMHHAGRIRVAVHGYNRRSDIDRLMAVLARCV